MLHQCFQSIFRRRDLLPEHLLRKTPAFAIVQKQRQYGRPGGKSRLQRQTVHLRLRLRRRHRQTVYPLCAAPDLALDIQYGFKGLGPGTAVGTAHPVSQSDHLGFYGDAILRKLLNGFQPAFIIIAGFRESDHITLHRPVSTPKGYLNLASHRDFFLDFLRYEILKYPV